MKATRPRERKLDCRSTSPRPPKRNEKPSTSSRFPTTEPVSEPRTTSKSIAFTAKQRDDQLGRVAEGRVQEAADAWPRVLGRMLGRLADQPGERDQRGRREHELERLRRSRSVVHEDHDRRERDGGEQEAADHRPRTHTPCAHCLKIRANVKSCGATRMRPQSRRGTACAGTDRASAPPSGRGGVPPLRGALRQGRLPRGVPRALVPVRLRVRGVGPHVRRLHAEGLRRSRSTSTCCGRRRRARTGSAAIRATRRAAADVQGRGAPCYEARGDELGCRNPEFHEIPRERPSFRVFAQLTSN